MKQGFSYFCSTLGVTVLSSIFSLSLSASSLDDFNKKPSEKMCLFVEERPDYADCFLSVDDIQLSDYQLVSLDSAVKSEDLRESVLSISGSILPIKSSLKSDNLLIFGQGIERSEEIRLCRLMRQNGFTVSVLQEGSLPLYRKPSIRVSERIKITQPAVILKELMNADPILVLVDQVIPDELAAYSSSIFQVSSSDTFWQEMASLQAMNSFDGLRPIVLIDTDERFSDSLLARISGTDLAGIYLMDGRIDDIVSVMDQRLLIELSKKMDLSRKRCN
ncbi:MAG: hypothetical protein ACR2PX_04470 [Endozoicomonas sp.]|uniref:hypothetical protein n=1 Tax=Endozoicomonas sp. TaxID=1892382 RepID=UPI003D9B6499